MSRNAEGRYVARVGEGHHDLRAVQRLRGQVFLGRDQHDGDDWDAMCRHVLIERRETGQLVGCFRILHLAFGAEIGLSYSAQFYDLTRLKAFDGPILEVGRFCIDPEISDPDIVRVAWAFITDHVDRYGITLLFGCTSFAGTLPEAYRDAFCLLKERHLAPRHWLPALKAPKVFRFARALSDAKPDLRAALAHMPPLLRSYLLLGGWVSDHAVVDEHLGTLHVFTGVEIAAIPSSRKRLLRAAAHA